MKKLYVFLLGAVVILTFISEAYAQDLKIADIQGNVFIRTRAVLPWRKAQLNEPLYKDYEILTKKNSECTISFGDDFSRVVTLKADTQLKIADILGKTLELSKGRVFALIDHSKTNQLFKIKTPTAIAGPRGSGWTVSFINKITKALCLKGAIHVQGLDKFGNPVSEKDVGEGFGVEILQEGAISELFRLAGSDEQEWQEFMNFIRDLVDESGESLFTEDEIDMLEDLRDMQEEQREDLRQDIIRELREQEEGGSGGITQDGRDEGY